MQTKLQELTEKIYKEGVERAESDAARIIAEATEIASQKLAQAHQESEAMLESARQKAEEIQRNSLNEVKLAARQLESDLQQRIIQMIEAELVPAQTARLFRDPGFIRELILKAASNWNPHSGEPVSLEVLLPQELLKQVEQYATEGARQVLDKGMKLVASDRAGQGFQIGPMEGGYRISFTDEDFNLFFRTYMRPRLKELLFGQDEKLPDGRA